MAKSSSRLLAVVTGGHAFDTVEFAELMQSLPGVKPVIQHLDDWCYGPAERRSKYDVVLFYTMVLGDPVDEGLPWYCGKQHSALSELGQTPQGIVVLHHGIVGFRKWQPWSAMVAISDRTSTAHWEGGHVTTDVEAADHPITRGLPRSWTLADESYKLNDPAGPDVEVLLTTRHTPSLRSIAWTNRYRKSRVFCYQSGHGATVYADANFRTVLANGIHWTANGA